MKSITQSAANAPTRSPQRLFTVAATALAFSILVTGCVDPVSKKEENKPQSIIGQKNQDIAEADPDAQQADLTAKGPLPSLGAYGFAVSQISKLKIKQSLEIYKAIHGDYPKDYETFMSEIIKKNAIELPVLPGGRQYQYDVDKHELIVVEKKDAKDR